MMSTIYDLKQIKLSTPAQWQTGLGSALRIAAGISPIRPLASHQTRVVTGIACAALSISHWHTPWWRDSAGFYNHGPEGCGDPGADYPDAQCSSADDVCRIEASPALLASPRLITGKRWLWAFTPGQGRVGRHDLTSLQFDRSFYPWHEGQLRDICSDGQDGLWLLVQGRIEPVQLRLIHLSAHGQVKQTIHLENLPCAVRAIHFLRHARRIALLGEDGQSLGLQTTGQTDGSNQSAPIWLAPGLQNPGFVATDIGGDGLSELVLCGASGFADMLPDAVPIPLLLILNQDGETIGRHAPGSTQGPLTGAVLDRGRLWFCGPNGVWFVSASAQQDGDSADGLYLTSALYSPDDASLRGWLRAEFEVLLPRGSSMIVTPLCSTDDDLRKQLQTLATQQNLAPGERIARMTSLLGANAAPGYVFASSLDAADAARRSSQAAQWERQEVPLFHIRQPWLWLLIRLCAAPAGELPQVRQCQVYYPEVSLMQYLPAIFQADAAQRGAIRGDPNGFLRQLVGVLETTSQGIDHLIYTLGRHIHPDSAEPAWLDFLARWLALPWHEALPEAEKRRLLQQASPILAGRGTRAGLRALLHALLPGVPFSLRDINVDFGMATLGTSTLPTLLTGLPAHASILNRRTRLGQARLPRADTPAESAQQRFLGILHIDIHARREQHPVLVELLPELIQASIPPGMQLRLHWRALVPPGLRLILDSGAQMDDASPRRLNQDSRLGLLTLAGSGHLQLREDGLHPGFQLE